MESEFDNIKEVEYYDYSRNFYPSDENTTSNSHTVESKQMRWTPNDNDNSNNILGEGVVDQTTTTTTTTSASTNNGQFDGNLLNSSDKIDLSQKLSPLVGSGDDNSLHHASTLENNGEEYLATGLAYDNKNGELLKQTNTIGAELDDNNDEDDENQQNEKILEKSYQPHHQQLVDADGDYGPETCVDVTDDVVMMTENSADTNNLSEQSTLSHSKDTLPSSDNCNPFDNKNALDMEENNEFQMGHVGVDSHHIHLDDANKATPLLSPEVEDLPLSSDGQMHFTNEGYQQSPLDDEIPVGIGCNQNEFEAEFMQSNGHLSPEIEKDEKAQEELNDLAKLEIFGDIEDMSNKKPELVENFFGSPTDPELDVQEKDNLFNNDENDFRLKDEEEILEKHVVESEEFAMKESKALDLSQKEQLQKSHPNLEVDILEEKPILTGHYMADFDESPVEQLEHEDEEKQDKEEFSEKEDKVEEKLSFVEQKSTPSEEIELEEEDNCIHLEEDVRPSDYLSMLEKQKEEQQQHLSQLDEGYEKDAQFEEEEAMKEHENSMFEEDNKVNDEMMEKEKSHLEDLHFNIENQLAENNLEKDQFQVEEIEKLAELQKQLQQSDDSEMINENLENNKLESEVASMMEEQFSLIEDAVVQPEKQCFEEPEKVQEKQETREEEENKFQENFDEEATSSPVKPTNEQVFEEVEKQLEENTEKQLSDHEDEFKSKTEEFMLDEVEKQLDENTEKHLLDVHKDEFESIEEQGKDDLELNEVEKHLDDETNDVTTLNEQIEKSFEGQPQNAYSFDDDLEEEPEYKQNESLDNTYSEDIDKQVQDLAEFVEDLENKHVEELKLETAKILGECTEEQLEKLEQQVLDAAALRTKRSENSIQPFDEPEIDPENMVEVEEPIIIKEQIPIKPSVVPVSGQEPSAVQPTHESCDESEDDEWKYTKENQGEKQLGLQGDIVVEEELPQEDGSLTFSINERKASGNILQQQISLNTSNLIESVNENLDDLKQNITELADRATAPETEEETIKQGVQNLNLSQSSTREKLDYVEDEENISASEMNSRLNPEAKEFIPTFSPPSTTKENGFNGRTPTAIPHHFKDELISQSPRKGRESNMEDINIPAENEFNQEIAHKPHGLPGDEAIVEPTENGGGELFQEMNWKEAMHGSEKEEGPLVESPMTEESLEVVGNHLEYAASPNVCELSAPVDLENAGMKQSIYIENNISNDDLNSVQILPDDDTEIGLESAETINQESNDVISTQEVQDILTLASDETKIESKIEDEMEHKMEQLLMNHDKEFTKDVKREAEEIPINGVELAPNSSVASVELVESLPEKPQIPSAPVEEPELILSEVPVAEEPKEGLALGAAIAAVAAATTAVAAAATATAVKKVEDEKNQKNLKKISATKPKVPDTKKPVSKTSTAPSVTAPKRMLPEKLKLSAASSVVNKKTTTSTVPAAARPRTAPTAGAVKPAVEKKTTTSTLGTVKSRIDTKPPTTMPARKPLVSSAPKTTTNKPGDETKSSSSTAKTSTIGKSSLTSRSSTASTKSSATNSITKRTSAAVTPTTNGTVTKTASAPKPTTLAPKSAAKPSTTSPRGTLTSTLRKTEAVKSPTKTTSSSTITSRVTSNGVTKSNTTTSTTRTTTTTKTSSSATASRTPTSRLSVTGTTPGSATTTPSSKTNNVLSARKSTPLKKTTNSSTTPIGRKSIGSKLNSPATKPTKDTSTPRPVKIPIQIQNSNNAAAAAAAEESKKKDDAAAAAAASVVVEPKLNGNASPDDVSLPPPSTEAAPVAAHPLIEMESA